MWKLQSAMSLSVTAAIRIPLCEMARRAKLICLWTSEPAGDDCAWIVVEHGDVHSKPKGTGSPSLEFRAVRNPPMAPLPNGADGSIIHLENGREGLSGPTITTVAAGVACRWENGTRPSTRCGVDTAGRNQQGRLVEPHRSNSQEIHKLSSRSKNRIRSAFTVATATVGFASPTTCFGSQNVAASDGVDYSALVLGIIAGLVIFLLGVERLSSAFSQVSDDRIKRLIDRFTTNAFTGVLTGAVACTILDSSSATIILVIAMIRGGLLTFKQSLGIVMGANIGTTIGAQIIAMDVFGYAPILLLLGFLIQLLARKPWQKTLGLGLLGAGMVFFGLGHLQGTVAPLRENEALIAWLGRLGERPALGAFAGCLVTLVIQSSSATVGMAIVLAKASLLPLPAGVAIMLGAEIGTVGNTLVASLGRGAEALRCAAFHLLFNLSTVIVGLLLIANLTALADRITPGDGDAADRIAWSIANAQVLFNVIGVAAFLPLLGPIAKLLEWAISEPGVENA